MMHSLSHMYMHICHSFKNQVQKRMALTIPILQDKISNVRDAVLMAYPMGLPEYDLVRISLDDESLEVSIVSDG